MSPEPWFRFEDEWGYRTAGHPEGASKEPCLRLVDGDAYPMLRIPNSGPAFEVIGSFVCPAGANTPWFAIRADERDRRGHLPRGS